MKEAVRPGFGTPRGRLLDAPKAALNECPERVLERQAVSLPLDPLCGHSKIVLT